MATRLQSRQFEVAVQVRFEKGPGADAAYRALNLLAKNRAMVARIVKAALAETVMRAFEQRFKAAAPLMMHMTALDDANKRRRLSAAKRAKIMKDFADRTREEQERITEGKTVRGNAEKYADVEAAYKEDMQRGDFQLELGDGAKSGTRTKAEERKRMQIVESVLYRGGRGRTELEKGMAKVLQLISAAQGIRVSHVGNQTIVGLGNLAALARIETPSYTEYADNHKSKSPYKILWRQLEYGTGYYARPKKVKPWWRYGTGKGDSRTVVKIKGSRGGHFLRTATGAAYDSDAVRFQGVFATLLARVLAGGDV